MIYSVAVNCLFVSWWLKFVFDNNPAHSNAGKIFNIN